MVDNFFELLFRLRDIGFQLIDSISNFGYNFFFVSINDYLGVSFGNMGDLTLCQFFLISGLSFWLGYKILKWIIF